jgi:PAS domain S-box-containing protein
MEGIENYLRLFENAPVAAAILEADTFKVDLANEAMLKLWGREADVIGMNLLDFMPELQDQPYPELMNHVFKTGKYYCDSGQKVVINRFGKPDTIFVDYSYTPIPDEKDDTVAILVLATETSDRDIENEEFDRELRSLVMSASLPMCVFKGDDLQSEIVNEGMLDLWCENRQLRVEALNDVYRKGLTYTERVNQTLYSYAPLRDGLGKTCGVVLIGNKMDN